MPVGATKTTFGKSAAASSGDDVTRDFSWFAKIAKMPLRDTESLERDAAEARDAQRKAEIKEEKAKPDVYINPDDMFDDGPSMD